MNSGWLWEARMRAWDRLWRVRMMVNRIRCWFIGHNEKMGNRMNHEPDWCDRCFTDWPGETTTLPDLLQRGYSWLVERDWVWFERLDTWLSANHRQKLPHWWAY